VIDDGIDIGAAGIPRLRIRAVWGDGLAEVPANVGAVRVESRTPDIVRANPL
jgi:hypothetical protein